MFITQISWMITSLTCSILWNIIVDMMDDHWSVVVWGSVVRGSVNWRSVNRCGVYWGGVDWLLDWFVMWMEQVAPPARGWFGGMDRGVVVDWLLNWLLDMVMEMEWVPISRGSEVLLEDSLFDEVFESFLVGEATKALFEGISGEDGGAEVVA